MAVLMGEFTKTHCVYHDTVHEILLGTPVVFCGHELLTPTKVPTSLLNTTWNALKLLEV